MALFLAPKSVQLDKQYTPSLIAPTTSDKFRKIYRRHCFWIAIIQKMGHVLTPLLSVSMIRENLSISVTTPMIANSKRMLFAILLLVSSSAKLMLARPPSRLADVFANYKDEKLRILLAL